MTLPQLICTSVGIWMFLVIGMAVAAYRENKRNLKQIRDAHNNQQTTLLDHDDSIWQELNIEYSEFPFVKLR